MKVFITTDMEGVAGVVSFKAQSYPDGKYFEHAKRLLTAEVNAAVEGLLEEGVKEILVEDAHGAEGIWFEDIHPSARLLHGRPSAPLQIRDKFVREYDVCMMIGWHAMAGNAAGNQNHTQCSRTIDYMKLNGKPIGEIGQIALYHGAFGMPVIFLSGDDAACREAEEFIPGIVTAAVKSSLSRSAAISLSAQEARRRIQEGTRRALQRHLKEPIAPVKWQGPFVLEKRFFHTDVADADAAVFGAERIDGQTIRFHGERIEDIIYK